jgi:hypothetical protein
MKIFIQKDILYFTIYFSYRQKEADTATRSGSLPTYMSKSLEGRGKRGLIVEL